MKRFIVTDPKILKILKKARAKRLAFYHKRLETIPVEYFSISNLKPKYPDIFLDIDEKSPWYIEDPKWSKL